MNNSLFVEGLVFSGVALGVIALVAWWLFLSPTRGKVADARPAPPGSARTFGVLIALGVLLFSVGGYWDASEHVVTGIVPGGDDFLWPPHIMIYLGFLLSFVVALAGVAVLARPNLAAGVRDPRLWVRRNPYVGATVLAAGYGLFSIPGDAIWHELYGIDLTAWSPPHVFLLLAAASTALCAIGLLLQSRTSERVQGAQALFILFLLAVLLNETYLIAVLEWEIGTVRGFILARPSWLYPTILGGLAFFVISLGRRLSPGPWTATTAALLFFAWRVGASAFAEVVSGAPPRLTLVFVLGAVLVDLAGQRVRAKGFRRALVEAAAFTLGYAAIALPTIQFVYLPHLVRFTPVDHAATVVVTFVVCALLQPLAQATGGWLLQHREEEAETSAALVPAAGD